MRVSIIEGSAEETTTQEIAVRGQRQEELHISLSTKQEILLQGLLRKLGTFKIDGLSLKDKKEYDKLTDFTTRMFIQLCWHKLGISLEQLKQLDQEELDELAKMIYERSKLPGLVQGCILVCIPLVGWLILKYTTSDIEAKSCYGQEAHYKNMRYCWWYRKIRDKYGKKFSPDLNIPSEF